MDGSRTRSFRIRLTWPFSELSEDTHRACLFAAIASDVDAEQPVRVLTWFAETGCAIVWC